MKVYEDLWRFEIYEDLRSFINTFEVCSVDISNLLVKFISKIVRLRIGTDNSIVLGTTTIFVRLGEEFLEVFFY